jgi:CDP-2,3-bis-(O-geranylgeranyl)-sn-glycerol synthase
VLESGMVSWVYEVAYALFFIFPAYVANAIPVLFGGGLAIDGGRKLWDGKPIFGSHKTVRGFVAGVVAGTLTGAVQTMVLQSTSPSALSPPYDFSLLLGFLVSLGALAGDLVHSFVKRRIGLKEGSSLPVADQLDFVVGAVLFSALVSPPPLLTIALILIITLPIHLLTNFVAYVIRVKKTPW